ncbi:MAG: hypothetical protein KDK70_44285, partial [Myxococcales bacterium]|nr:hypothetical protein [Myxococcales bacterium]
MTEPAPATEADPWASVPIQSVVPERADRGRATPRPLRISPKPPSSAPLLDPWAPRASRPHPVTRHPDLRDPFGGLRLEARSEAPPNADPSRRPPETARLAHS